MKRKLPSRIAAPDADQMTMAGVQPLTLGDRLTWVVQQPMQPRCGQRPLDIGFWDPMRNQLEMF